MSIYEFLAVSFAILVAWYCWTVYKAPMMDFPEPPTAPRIGKPVPTISRDWWVAPTIIALVAGLLGCAAAYFAPELARGWPL